MNKRGFTLVEILVSFGVLLILSGSLLYAFNSGTRVWKRLVLECEHLQINNLVLERICRDIRSASEILPGSSAGKLVLKVDSEVIAYWMANQKICREKGGTLAYLTNEGEVPNLRFAYPERDLVEVAMGNFITYAALRN